MVCLQVAPLHESSLPASKACPVGHKISLLAYLNGQDPSRFGPHYQNYLSLCLHNFLLTAQTLCHFVFCHTFNSSTKNLVLQQAISPLSRTNFCMHAHFGASSIPSSLALPCPPTSRTFEPSAIPFCFPFIILF